MKVLAMPQNSFAQQSPVNFDPFQGMSSQQQIVFPFTPTAATTPVQPSNNLSNQRTSSFNPWDLYIEHE